MYQIKKQSQNIYTHEFIAHSSTFLCLHAMFITNVSHVSTIKSKYWISEILNNISIFYIFTIYTIGYFYGRVMALMKLILRICWVYTNFYNDHKINTFYDIVKYKLGRPCSVIYIYSKSMEESTIVD